MESFLWYYINITQKDGHTVSEQQQPFRNSDNQELKKNKNNNSIFYSCSSHGDCEILYDVNNSYFKVGDEI